MNAEELFFGNPRGTIPAVVVEYGTDNVVAIVTMSKEALEQTLTLNSNDKSWLLHVASNGRVEKLALEREEPGYEPPSGLHLDHGSPQMERYYLAIEEINVNSSGDLLQIRVRPTVTGRIRSATSMRIWTYPHDVLH